MQSKIDLDARSKNYGFFSYNPYARNHMSVGCITFTFFVRFITSSTNCGLRTSPAYVHRTIDIEMGGVLPIMRAYERHIKIEGLV